MKYILVPFILSLLQISASAACKVSIQGQRWIVSSATTILSEKGYEIVKIDADLELRFEGAQYAWDMSWEKFSYAVPLFERKIPNAPCPIIKSWDLSCREKTRHKRRAMKCVLEKMKTNLPSIN